MATEKQIQANKLNALRSTGPTTVDGKMASRRNAVKHGLTAEMVVLDGEDPKIFEALRSSLHDEFDAKGILEEMLVERISGLVWRLRRIPALETALLAWIQHLGETKDHSANNDPYAQLGAFDYQRLDPTSEDEPDFATLRQRSLGRALETALSQSDLLTRLSRYEVMIMNQLQRTLGELEHRQREQISIEGIASVVSG